jgi:hypothetical protein
MFHYLSVINFSYSGSITFFRRLQFIFQVDVSYKIPSFVFDMIYILYDTFVNSLVGRLSGIRTQSGQTKINDGLTAKNYRLFRKNSGFAPCPVFAGYTLEFALQLRKKHGKISVRVAEECQLAR